MSVRLLAPPPHGRHARLNLLDRVRALPRVVAVLLVVMPCLSCALGFALGGVLL